MRCLAMGELFQGRMTEYSDRRQENVKNEAHDIFYTDIHAHGERS